MSESPPIQGERVVVLDTLEQLKAVADPLRLRLLVESVDEPRTVKQMAGLLGVPVTRLYYHVKMLEGLGLLEVAGRRMVSGIEERSYLARGTNWSISNELMGTIAASGVIRALLDIVGSGLELALSAEGPPVGDIDGAVPGLTYTRWYLTREEVAEVREAFVKLMREKPDDLTGRVAYDALITFYKAPTNAP